MSEQKENIKALLEKHNLTVESVFVPLSQSRNAGEKYPSLNWIITLKHNGHKILATDYSAGCAHCPSYKKVNPDRMWGHNVLTWECENGKELDNQGMKMMEIGYGVGDKKRNPIFPDSVDVVYSLLMDSEVLDYPDYEDWANCFGYDPDSRSGEKVYQACMKIALQFRQLGESVISELREVFQDY